MKRAISILSKYNELWLGPLGFFLYFVCSKLMKFADPEAVPYTLDAVQKILFGHLVFATCTFSVWVSLRMTWPSVFRFLVNDFNENFNQLNTWEKLKLSFSVFACYLLGLILSMQVL